MKKSLLLVSLGLLLVGCGETNNSSIEEKNTLNELLTSLSNKFHTTYKNSEGTFSYYQQPNYTFDTYTNVGLIVMNNGGCYEYTLYEDNIICSLPSLNDKSYFETYRQTINLSLDDFSLVDNKYVSSDENICNQVASLANYYNISKVEVEEIDHKLNFYLYDKTNKLVVSGIVDDEENELISNYISTYESPNKINNSNEELISAMGALNNDYIFEGRDYLNNYPIYVKMNGNGYYEGTSSSYEYGSGYIVLEDGAHSFINNKNGFSVSYQVGYSKVDYDKYFNLGKVFYNKFIKMQDHSYLSYDPYNIYSFANFFGVDASKVTHLVFDVFSDYVSINFFNQDALVVGGNLKNINSTSIEVIDNYVKGSVRPSLEHKSGTEELVVLTSSLNNNFTYYKKNDYVEEDEYLELKSTEKGRFVATDVILTPKNNYYIIDDTAYEYTLENEKMNLSVEKSISKDEYLNLFTFKKIDFATFNPLGNNVYQTSDSTTLKILNNILDGNSNSKYQESATISIIDNKLHFVLKGGNMTWSEGYIDNINSTSIDLFNQEIAAPTWINNDNSDLKTYIDVLKANCNFTIEYASSVGTGDVYDEKSYDYWTNETVYFGFFENGITYSEAGYLYEYGYQEDDDGKQYFAISQYPFKYETIQDFNPLKTLDDTWINRFEKVSDNHFVSSYEYIINIFASLTDLTSYQIEKVDLVLDNDELIIKLIDEDTIYGPMTITNVNKTKIPSFANNPKIY